MKRFVLIFSLFLFGLALSACASRQDTGRRAGTPDEFRVVKKAPLTVPPEYSLRPPGRGEQRPAEVDPSQQNRTVAFGTDIGANASAVEKMMVAKARAIAVNPVIREMIDYEEAGLLRKGAAISDDVVNYRGTPEERARAEQDNATGGEEVRIERGSGVQRIKLPGT